MEKLYIVIITLLLFSMIITTTPTPTAVRQSPEEVENWILNLKHSKPKLTKLHFYYHNSRNYPDKNLSAVAVATSPPAFADNFPFFGVMTITDNPLTVGPEVTSKKVGYSQGLYVTASLEEVSMYMGFTFVFSDGDHNGSTLSVLGRNSIEERYRELSVVGGTGVFRLAKGIVTMQTHSINFTAGVGVAVLEMDVVALHY